MGPASPPHHEKRAPMEASIYSILTNRIDRFFAEMKANNSFYQRIFSGEISHEEIARFVKNVTFLTAHTPHHLQLAVKMASEKSDKKLTRYYKAKLHEEVGHDQWGESDLKQLNERFSLKDGNTDVLSEMKDYVAANERMIADDPLHYFVYILFAEYYTVIAGPECLEAIKRSKNVPREMMSIIDKHAELDKDHVHEWSQQARVIGLKVEDASVYLKVLEKILKRYDSFAKALSGTHAKAA